VRIKPFDYNFFFIQTKNGESLKSSYEQFMANAQIIKQLTNGKYNLLKSGSIMKAVLHRFYHLNQHLVVEPIEIDEADWLNKAFKGGIIFAQSGYKGNGIEYDFNAFYASILASQNFSFPITKGSFVIMSEQEFSQLKFFRFGIYRVEITNINHRLFKHNGDNYYTHFDLTRAKELGYPIKLIQDGKPNALLYDGNGKRVNGDVCFKPMVNELYELKKQYGKKYPIIKQLLLLIWGGLCEHKKHIHSRKLSNYTPVDDEDPAVLVSIVDAGDYTHFHTKSLAFNSDYGRLGVFLTSRARQIISRTMEPHIDKIVRCHTDGFISRSELQWPKSAKVEIGTDLGHLKFEGQWSSLHIVNANKIINLETGNSYKK